MATTIQERSTTLRDQQELAKRDRLTLKVFFKVFLIKDRGFDDKKRFREYLNFLYDEPVLFLILKNDIKSREYLNDLGYKYRLITLTELRTYYGYSLTSLFILNHVNRKILKIIEIICNKTINQSVLLI